MCNFYLFIYLCLCWVFVAAWGFLQLWRVGCSLVAALRLLVAVAPPVAERGLPAGGRQQLHTGSAAVAPGLPITGSTVLVCGISCSVPCGIFPDQESNLSPLHWQADCLPLSHQGSPQSALNKQTKKLHFFNSLIRFWVTY